MTLVTFVLKNLLRRKMRSLLTAAAIAIGVGVVVALVGIASNFEKSFLDLYGAVGIKLMVVKANSSKTSQSLLDESLGDAFAKIPGVQSVLPGLADTISYSRHDDKTNFHIDLPAILVQGLIPETPVFEHYEMESGRNLLKGDGNVAVIGTTLASNAQLKVGDTIMLYDEKMGPTKIVGIFRSFSVFENGAITIPLAELQRQTSRTNPNQITGFSIITAKNVSDAEIDAIAKEIHRLEPSVKALPTQQQVSSIAELKIAKGMAWMTSAIALIVGSLGMINTMSMAVLERQKEIGILRAVGWRRGRVLRLILLESVGISVVGALLGMLGAFLLVKTLTRLPMTAGFIAGSIEPRIYLYGLLIAIGIGFLGGLLPAWHASRVTPTVALSHE